jgi:hypothetical protein
VGKRACSVCCFVDGADCLRDFGKPLEKLPKHTRENYVRRLGQPVLVAEVEECHRREDGWWQTQQVINNDGAARALSLAQLRYGDEKQITALHEICLSRSLDAMAPERTDLVWAVPPAGILLTAQQPITGIVGPRRPQLLMLLLIVRGGYPIQDVPSSCLCL